MLGESQAFINVTVQADAFSLADYSAYTKRTSPAILALRYFATDLQVRAVSTYRARAAPTPAPSGDRDDDGMGAAWRVAPTAMMQPNPTNPRTVNEASIERLRECLRSELSAAETYQFALSHLSHVGIHSVLVLHVGIHSVLQQILASHAARADRLGEHLRGMGADATKSFGVWGVLAKIVQAGADLLGDRAALTALNEGEDHGLKLYLDTVPQCDAPAQGLIETYLLPEQRRTRELCASLKEYVNAPS